MWRLNSVFYNSLDPKFDLEKYSDLALSQYLVALLVIQTILLVAWKFVDLPQLLVLDYLIPASSMKYQIETCGVANASVSIVLVAWNVVLLMYMVRLAVSCRNIHSQFSEGKKMGVLL
jgi:hypothetical protein